jgi:hypothetical protein
MVYELHMRARVGRNLGEQDDTRLAGIAHGVSGDLVAVGGLGYLFAPEEQPSQLNRAAHRSQEAAHTRWLAKT